jgi:hypothetical protein
MNAAFFVVFALFVVSMIGLAVTAGGDREP